MCNYIVQTDMVTFLQNFIFIWKTYIFFSISSHILMSAFFRVKYRDWLYWYWCNSHVSMCGVVICVLYSVATSLRPTLTHMKFAPNLRRGECGIHHFAYFIFIRVMTYIRGHHSTHHINFPLQGRDHEVPHTSVHS